MAGTTARTAGTIAPAARFSLFFADKMQGDGGGDDARRDHADGDGNDRSCNR